MTTLLFSGELSETCARVPTVDFVIVNPKSLQDFQDDKLSILYYQAIDTNSAVNAIEKPSGD